jgi:hypothetical protein
VAEIPWVGGPPSRGELENWLVSQRDIPREEARSIAQSYAVAGLHVDSGLTRSELSLWVDNAIQTNTAQGAESASTGGDFEGVSAAAEEQLRQREMMDEARSTSHTALADQRTNVVNNQVQSYYDRARITTDAGPQYDAAGLANSLAIGVQVDAAGNPITDDEGNPMGVSAAELWQEIRGLSFNMGQLAMPFPAHRTGGPREGSFARHSTIRGIEGPVEEKRRQRRGLDADAARAGRTPGAKYSGLGRLGDQKRILNPSEALAILGSLDESYITELQQEMYEAGLYDIQGEGVVPVWGVADASTRKALIDLFTTAAQRDPNKPINRLLDELASERVGGLGPPESGPGAEANPTLVDIPDFTPDLTSEATLSQLADDMAQDLFGEFVPEDRKRALIAKLQERETATQRAEYDISVANIREQAAAQHQFGGSAGGGGGAAGGGGIDAFMAAIGGQESGGDYSASNNYGVGHYGKYQISNTNWAPWATRAGLGPNAPRTPENQEIVARRIMLDYYQQFGNWRDVAVAWYAGPGRVARVRNSQSNQAGGPSISDYADSVMDRMAGFQGGAGGGQAGIIETGGDINAAIQRFDPAAEAEAILKAQDPVGWEAHEFANRATEFYSLLGGVI